MNVRIFMAISPNGYIARKDGAEDWLSPENWNDFVAQASEARNFIIGRETYEMVKQTYSSYMFDDVPAERKIIVTRNADYEAPDSYTIAHNPQEALALLEGYDTALITGGGILNAEFLKQKLVNELCLNIQPYVIGSGRSLFADGTYETFLELQDIKRFDDGRVQLWYKILNKTNEST